MKTNLIFKRTNQGKVEMVMVPVDIPQINSGEGWVLASCCDMFTKYEAPSEAIVVTGSPLTTVEEVVDVIDTTSKDGVSAAPQEVVTAKKEPETHDVPVGGSYQSQVNGTARLVRYKDKIRITYRKGKTTFNRNDPNSVCIDDMTKQQFFNAVKRQYGTGVLQWQLVLGDTEYTYYNELIDKLYEQGRVAYNKLPVVSGER